jgi:hypothetical protein
MTAIQALRWNPVFLPETGVSEDAPKMGRLWFTYRAIDNSLTRGLSVVDLLRRIEEVAEAARVNDWDGEGGVAVEPSAVDYAWLFASAIPSHLPEPDISVDNDGDIAFEWSAAPRKVFSVSIRRDGVIAYAGLNGADEEHGSSVIFSGLPARMIESISRVAS